MPSRYKEILDKIIWSFSTLHLYENCPYAFYLKKICEIVGVGNDYADIGKFAHELNSAIFANDMTIDEAMNKWVDDFDGYHYSISKSTANKKLESFCDYLLNFDERYSDKYHVIGNELKAEWKIGKYNFIGYIDLLLQDKETGDILLIDHKSAGKFFGKKGQLLKSQEEKFKVYKNQMYLYCIPIYAKYKKYPKYIIWNHIFDGEQTKIPFDIEEFETTKKWAIKTIKQIYKETDFEAKQQYMMCRMLCDYRIDDCEYSQEKENIYE